MEFENKIVLATAFASHRVNGGYFPDTRRFSEGTATLFSNKEMMIYNLSPEDDKLIPSDFTKFNITEEDYKNAELGVAFLMKENALQIIAGTLTDFMKNFLSLIKAEKIQRDNFGIVCLLPKIYFEKSKNKTLKNTMKEQYGESMHIGTIGDKLFDQEVFVTDIKFVDKFGCHAINGAIGNNLISFFKEFEQGKPMPKPDTKIKINAKVKRHGENWITKMPETQLNYVKILNKL